MGSGGASVTVSVTNTAPAAVAFLVHLRLVQASNGSDVWPVVWSDNYFSLLPGESRTGLTAAYDANVGLDVQVIAESFNAVVQPARSH